MSKRLKDIKNPYAVKMVHLPEGLTMRNSTRLCEIYKYNHNDKVIHERSMMDRRRVDEFINNIRSAAEVGKTLTWCCLEPMTEQMNSGIMIRDHFFVNPNPDATPEEIKEAKTIVQYRRLIIEKHLRDGIGIPFYFVKDGEIICLTIYTLPQDASRQLQYLLSCL